MQLVFIYGAPAVGKLTTARALAALTDFKVFHNHLSIDAIEPIFDFGTKPFWKLVNQLRFDILAEAARADVDLIQTFCYAKDADDDFIRQTIEIVESNGGTICFVLLTCDRAELERRALAESRRQSKKIRDVATLREVLSKHELFAPVPQRASLRIDTTDSPAAETARRIAEHFKLL